MNGSALAYDNDYPSLSPSPALNLSSPELLRQQLTDYFLETFDCYESLFRCLQPEGFYQKPIALRHPLIFYYGHTATFFINKLRLSQLISAPINAEFEAIFAVGVDEMSWDDLDEQHYNWPSIAEVQQYRDQVRHLVLDLLQHAPLNPPIDWKHPWWALIMAIEHERIHLETSSVLIRQQQLQWVKSTVAWTTDPEQNTVAPTNVLQAVSAAAIRLDKNQQDAYYAWDNEYAQHHAPVNRFQASRYLVSNQEFLAFVDAGGYQNLDFWTPEGQQWLKFSQAQHPTFWQPNTQGWQLRLMTQSVDMPWSWPVEVNYHEAKAFCQWMSQQYNQPIRLPSEDEWYRLYDAAGLAQTTPYANLSLNMAASTCPVDRCQQGDFFDVVGNVWQWTETPIYPFEGFQVHPIYDDFSTPTFDGQHHLIKGGSWISSGNEIQRSARYAFRRHFFQHAGFRYVCAEPLQSIHSQYETDVLVSQYLDFQYTNGHFGVPNFAKSLVELALPHLNAEQMTHALDLGCATGRASFELAQYFAQVTALDFSARFIQHAVQLQHGKTARYQLIEEGELTSQHDCQLSTALLAHAHKVAFFQADACQLKAQFSNYDFVLAANLIDRLHHPADFLAQLHQRIRLGGLLLIASPYTWLEQHTAREHWLGGFQHEGEAITTLQGLHAHLDAHFQLIDVPLELEFVIRETARKFQHSYAQVSLWRRIDSL